MFDFAIDQTQPSQTAQVYQQKLADRPKPTSALTERRAAEPASTQARSFDVIEVSRVSINTATVADLSERRQRSTTLSTPTLAVDVESTIDKTSNDRVTLLARKYAGKIDNEGSARLKILTERLNQLVPAVEDASIDRVAELVAVARYSNPAIAALKLKYKI